MCQHHWTLEPGFAATGVCDLCGKERLFTSALLPPGRKQIPKRPHWDILGDSYGIGLALRLARDSGCRVNSFNNRGGRI